jgi:hypothetical protein
MMFCPCERFIIHFIRKLLIDPDGALGRTTKDGARVAGSRSLILYIASFLICSTSVISGWKTVPTCMCNSFAVPQRAATGTIRTALQLNSFEIF